jgi:hypothetical protein
MEVPVFIIPQSMKTGKPAARQQIMNVGGQISSLVSPGAAVSLPVETTLRMLLQSQGINPIFDLIAFHET